MAVLLIITTLVCVVASIEREYTSALFSRSADLKKIEILTSQPDILRPPFSVRGQREVFEACAQVRDGLLYGLQSAEGREHIDARCTEMAQSALQRSPTLSAAHVTTMLFARTPQEMANALVRSWATAPMDFWEAQKRLSKGFGLFGNGFDTLEQAVAKDVEFLMQFHHGRAFLVQRYRNDPAVRPTLVALVEVAPNAQQAAFLTQVRRNAR